VIDTPFIVAVSGARDSKYALTAVLPKWVAAQRVEAVVFTAGAARCDIRTVIDTPSIVAVSGARDSIRALTAVVPKWVAAQTADAVLFIAGAAFVGTESPVGHY